MDEIEVKLSPLDEDSKQALLSFVNALDEVRQSMDSIKTSFATELLDFKSVLNRAATAYGSGGGGVAEQAANQILGPNGQPLTGAGQSSSSASRATASPTTPASGGALGGTPNVDQGGHGGTFGGGGTGDQTKGYPYPPSSSGPNYGLPKNAEWYSGDLQIPRINEFNIQDYTRMAGKVVGGGAATRYQDNYQQRYQENINRGMTSDAAAQNAGEYASAERSKLDRVRLGAASGLAELGKTGPFLAATQNLAPQILSGPSGIFGAAGLQANMNAQMGISGSPTSILDSPFGLPKLLAYGLGQGRQGRGEEALYRFGSMLGEGRGLTDPKALNLFSMQERGALAEASMEVNLRGGEFDVAKSRYTTRRESALPAMAPGQYAEMMKEQTRYGAVSAEKAADNLDKLADSALTAGMNVRQMGEAAQAYHAANPQLTMAQSIEQSAGYGMAAVNPAMASELLANPSLSMGSYEMGMTPAMLAGTNPSDALRMMGAKYRQLRAPFENAGMSEKQIQAMLYSTNAITAEQGKVLQNAEGYAALGDVQNNLGGSVSSLRKDLAKVAIPDKNGKLDTLTDDEINEVLRGRGGKDAEGKKLTLEGRRSKALRKVLEEKYGYDVRDPETETKVRETEVLRSIRRKYGKDSDEYKRAIEAKHELRDQMTANGVKIDFTPQAKAWLKIADGNTPKPGGASPKRKGKGIFPSITNPIPDFLQ